MQDIYVRRYGHGPRKIVGIHGWFGDERSYDRLEEALDPGRVECAWPALRGIGPSRGVVGDYSIAEMASDALDVGWNLGWSSFSLVGHSMGGKAALLAAATAPATVERVLALAPVPLGAEVFPPEVWRTFDRAANDSASRRAVISASLGEQGPEHWVERLAAEAGERAKAEVMRSYLRSWVGDDHREVVAGCGVPTLAVVGTRDPSITEQSVTAEFGDLLTDWRVASIAGAGHYVLDEAPLQVGAIAQEFFLRDSADHW
ncbi:alpha/beta fold hydrolase [Leucobacter chromiireducens]|nr:alpha/beta hydrolase [Leucobacter chromiireducens]